MESLKRVQKIAKVFQILTIIAFVSTLVGFGILVISSIAVGVWGDNEQIMKMMLDMGVSYDKQVALCTCICAAIGCAFGAVMLYYTKMYFEDVLKVGTPFDKGLCNELKKLGIIYMILSVVSAIVVAIVSAGMKVGVDFNTDSLFTVGLVFFVIAFVFDYGADIRAENLNAQKSELNHKENSAETESHAAENNESEKNLNKENDDVKN
mgnify:FL=1